MKKLLSFLALLVFGLLTLTSVHANDGEKIYFAKYYKNDHLLVDTETGEIKDFIPQGYHVISPKWSYDAIPEFLILWKDNNIFSYEVKSEKINKILPDDLLLKENEWAIPYPSITEKDKFFIQFFTRPVEEGNPDARWGVILPDPIHTRSYLFDASSNELVHTDNIEFKGCLKYDSKYQRFFAWLCGPGIGSSIPLSILDMKGEVKKEVLSLADFGLKEDEKNYSIEVNYNNGLLFAAPKIPGQMNQIIVVDANAQDLKKEIFSLSEEIRGEMEDFSPYSMALDRDKNTFVLGGGQSVIVLRFEGRQIQESQPISEIKTIPQEGGYINNIFLNEGVAYYQSMEINDFQPQSKRTNKIQVLDLSTGEIIKSVTTPNGDEITIIKEE